MKLGQLLLISFLVLASCTAKIPSPEVEEAHRKWHAILQNQTTPGPQQKPKEGEDVFKPRLVEVSPLQKKVNLAFHQEYYENVLSFLAMQAGLSFIVDPQLRQVIPPERSRISFQFYNKSLEEAINKICEILDCYPKIEKGILHLLPYEERTFNLGFLPVVKESQANLGGDVLGNIGGGAGLTSPLKGEFSLTSQLSRDYLEIYTNLEQTIQNLLSPNGKYELNKAAGILYVKDKPSHVRAIAKFIQEFTARYRKQIILDVQIVEIELGKDHNIGIDWLSITNYLMGQNRVSFDTLDLDITTRTDQPSISLTISGQPNVNLLYNLLKQYGELKVLQNPKIRVLHSQPAIISVGTAFSYIKEVKRNVETGTTNPTVTYTAETSSVFEGVLLGVVPYLSNTDEIYLHIVPIKSELVGLRDVRFGADYFISLPTVNLREMSSIVKAKPGDLIVIGGLILDKQKNTERQLALPLLDNIFRTQTGSGKVSELVIVIRLLVD